MLTANARVLGQEIAWFQEVMTARLTHHAGQAPAGEPLALVPAPIVPADSGPRPPSACVRWQLQGA